MSACVCVYVELFKHFDLNLMLCVTQTRTYIYISAVSIKRNVRYYPCDASHKTDPHDNNNSAHKFFSFFFLSQNWTVPHFCCSFFLCVFCEHPMSNRNSFFFFFKQTKQKKKHVIVCWLFFFRKIRCSDLCTTIKCNLYRSIECYGLHE